MIYSYLLGSVQFGPNCCCNSAWYFTRLSSLNIFSSMHASLLDFELFCSCLFFPVHFSFCFHLRSAVVLLEPTWPMTGRYSDIYNKRKGTCRIKVGAYTVFIPLLLNSNATVWLYMMLMRFKRTEYLDIRCMHACIVEVAGVCCWRSS